MSIDDDSYFELMMNNCWKMNDAYTGTKKGWSDKEDSGKKGGKTLQDNYASKKPDTSVHDKLKNKSNQSNIFHRDEPGQTVDAKPKVEKKNQNKSNIFHRDEPEAQSEKQTPRNIEKETPRKQEKKVEEDKEDQEEQNRGSNLNKSDEALLEKFREKINQR
jgi:hypothetical protein